MNDKVKGLVVGVCTLMELGCIAGLAAIGLKRNKDCYEAEMKLIETEVKLWDARFDNTFKDAKIERLEKELEKLKSEPKEEA